MAIDIGIRGCPVDEYRTMYSRRVAEQKLNYMHNNPVKAGLSKLPEDYPFSSYQYYELNKDDWGFITHYEEHL